MQKGPSYSSSAATYPEKSANAQSRKSVSMRACAFFSPRFDPVLDRGKRHKDAVVAPQVPTRRAVGQAVLHDEPHRQIDDAVGIATARWREIREVGVEILTTFRTVVLRIGDQEIPGAPGIEIPQVVQCPLGLFVTIGRVVTTRTYVALVGAIIEDDLCWWQVCRRCNTFWLSRCIGER